MRHVWVACELEGAPVSLLIRSKKFVVQKLRIRRSILILNMLLIEVREGLMRKILRVQRLKLMRVRVHREGEVSCWGLERKGLTAGLDVLAAQSHLNLVKLLLLRVHSA